MLNDTIVAPITPLFMSAVGTLRISGSEAIQITEKIFSKPLKEEKTHTLHHGFIFDENDQVVDDVVVALYRNPSSYTGEDVVEISCHGSVFIINKMQKLIVANGARLAQNGEFSKRAFLNGKMDIAQAEAVIDLIETESENEAAVALGHLRGFLSKEINEIRQSLLDIVSQILAYIDYPDDEIGEVSYEELEQTIRISLEKVEKLEKSFNVGQIIKNGIKVSILGKPNVGKSFIMNRLLGYERSIVTDIAGTTRDVVEERATLGGIKLYISDTAGIRGTEDIVEKIGVEKAMENVQNSDLALCVFDSSRPADNEDKEVIKTLKALKIKKIAIINKTDLKSVFDEKLLTDFDKKIYLSAKENIGFEELEKATAELFSQGLSIKSNEIITNQRQYQCLVKAKEALTESLNDILMTPDIILINIEAALEALSMIVGKSVNEEIVENIFSRFCVGK